MWRSGPHTALVVVAACVSLGSCGEQTLFDPPVQGLVSGLEDDLMMRGWMEHVRSYSTHLQKDVLSADFSDVAVQKEVLMKDKTPKSTEGKSSKILKYKFEGKWFNQKLDHVNRQNVGHWWQRYFVYDKYSRTEINYPLFVFCGAEQGDIFLEWEHLGFMVEVAKQHGAKVLWLEHRFFGESMPFRDPKTNLPAGNWNKSADRVGLLSLEQSIADYAEIIRAHRGEGPVLTFGGSLSGTMATMMRVSYPTLVDMAFASSAPILGVDGTADPFAWRKRLTDNFAEVGSPGCPDAVRRGFAALAAAVAQPGGEAHAKLWKAIKPCESEKQVGPQHWQAVSGLGWAELERLGNFVYPAALSQIPATCKRMENASSGEEVFAALLNIGKAGPKNGKCLNFTKMSAAPAPNNGVGAGWSYMACTEVVHPIAGNNVTDMFPPYGWTVKQLTTQCQASWKVSPYGNYLKNKLDVPTEGFGINVTVKRAPNLPGRILFTWGEFDPWGTMVPKQGWADDVKVVKVPGGSHCSDLETARPEDTPGMKDAREQVRTQLASWIEEVRHLRMMKVNDFGKSVTVKQNVVFGKNNSQPIGLRSFGDGKNIKLRGARSEESDSHHENDEEDHAMLTVKKH